MTGTLTEAANKASPRAGLVIPPAAKAISEERYPGRRQSIMKQWQQQDRDWRSFLPVSGTATG